MFSSVIFWSIFILGALGLIFGISLAIASYIFEVKSDPKVNAVFSVLPDLNCGSCGYPGCKKYAEAVAKNGEKVNLCMPGGSDAVAKIAEIMGIEINIAPGGKNVAFIFCCGGTSSKKVMNYQGIPDCNAAALVSNGPLQCDYGCMMYYSCYKACKFNAIKINSDGLPEVIPDNCTACMACVKSCPKNIIKLIPHSASVFVLCNSKDRGKDVMDACTRGCISCMRCVKACPVNAIHMDEGLAIIDQNKCQQCLKCVEVCPVKVIRTTKKIEVDVCQQN